MRHPLAKGWFTKSQSLARCCLQQKVPERYGKDDGFPPYWTT